MAERDAAAAVKGKSGKAKAAGKADVAAGRAPQSGPGVAKPPAAGGKSASGAAGAKAGDGKGKKKKADPLVSHRVPAMSCALLYVHNLAVLPEWGLYNLSSFAVPAHSRSSSPRRDAVHVLLH